MQEWAVKLELQRILIGEQIKVLSLQEKEGYESVATAKMNNLFHFNCFHYVIPFMGEPKDEERTIIHTDDNKKSYERNVKKGIKRKLID